MGISLCIRDLTHFNNPSKIQVKHWLILPFILLFETGLYTLALVITIMFN
jgi:hypothetical protein